MKFIPFILFTVLTNAAAQLMLKQGMTNLSPITLGPLSFAGDTLIGKLGMTLLNPWVVAGLIALAVARWRRLRREWRCAMRPPEPV